MVGNKKFKNREQRRSMKKLYLFFLDKSSAITADMAIALSHLLNVAFQVNGVRMTELIIMK